MGVLTSLRELEACASHSAIEALGGQSKSEKICLARAKFWHI
jgi:hypothetical protein